MTRGQSTPQRQQGMASWTPYASSSRIPEPAASTESPTGESLAAFGYRSLSSHLCKTAASCDRLLVKQAAGWR